MQKTTSRFTCAIFCIAAKITCALEWREIRTGHILQCYKLFYRGRFDENAFEQFQKV